MNSDNRLKNATKIWSEIKVKEEYRKGINNDINALNKKVIEALLDDKNEVKIETLKGYYKRIKKSEGERKEINAIINRLKASLEDCIMGKGDYDAKQLDIDDVLKEEPKEKENKKKKEG